MRVLKSSQYLDLLERLPLLLLIHNPQIDLLEHVDPLVLDAPHLINLSEGALSELVNELEVLEGGAEEGVLVELVEEEA